jgi:hypothetical protein
MISTRITPNQWRTLLAFVVDVRRADAPTGQMRYRRAREGLNQE